MALWIRCMCLIPAATFCRLKRRKEKMELELGMGMSTEKTLHLAFSQNLAPCAHGRCGAPQLGDCFEMIYVYIHTCIHDTYECVCDTCVYMHTYMNICEYVRVRRRVLRNDLFFADI